MIEAQTKTSSRSLLASALRAFVEGNPIQLIRDILGSAELLKQLRDSIGYHGMYEILDYRSTLDLFDETGERATISRYQMIRFLQDNVVAIHDHAWGDGELFSRYHCQPGTAVDFYRDGSKWNVLISLRETKNRGDTIPVTVQRTIAGGFLAGSEWLETEVDHLTSRLHLSVVFPKARPCLRATLTRKTASKTEVLAERNFRTLPSGRQELNLSLTRPKLHECYTIKWDW